MTKMTINRDGDRAEKKGFSLRYDFFINLIWKDISMSPVNLSSFNLFLARSF